MAAKWEVAKRKQSLLGVLKDATKAREKYFHILKTE